MRTAMGFAALRSQLRSHRFAWLLALLLWLPVAQWAAATHALLHLHASVSDERELPAHLPGSCDLCVVAAVVGGAAPLPEAPAAHVAAIEQVRPQSVRAAAVLAAPAVPYQSRAPPSLHA
jgi:hypothetical protein